MFRTKYTRHINRKINKLTNIWVQWSRLEWFCFINVYGYKRIYFTNNFLDFSLFKKKKPIKIGKVKLAKLQKHRRKLTVLLNKTV